MSVSAPPRPTTPRLPEVCETPEALEALIEEARRRARRRRIRNAAFVVAVGVTAFAVFGSGHRSGSRPQSSAEGVAPAARAPSSSPVARANGPLTIIGGRGISSIGSDGRLVPVFDCQATPGCIDLQSIAWSPDGRRLAFSVTGVGAGSAYLGLHVYEPASHRDRQISRLDGFSVAWSPDGSRIAYVVSSWFPMPWGTIYVMNADGSDRRPLQTGTSGADMSPSWSPDGRRLLFATTSPIVSRLRDSVVSIVDLDGSHRRLVARHAFWPAWSPDGTRIAYRARCGGVKVMTPQGVDVTPAVPALGCRRGATRGTPVWSPDGRRLAIVNKHGVFVEGLDDGSEYASLVTGFVSRDTGRGLFGTATPSWRSIALP